MLITDVFSLVGITCAIVKNLDSTNKLASRDLEQINKLFKGNGTDDLDNDNSRRIWEPEIIIKYAKEYNFKRADLLKHLVKYHKE